MRWMIYALRSTDDRVTRYVGQTSKCLSVRLKGHITAARGGKLALHEWVRDQHERDTLEIVPLQETDQPNTAERILIASFPEGQLLNFRRGWESQVSKLIAPVLLQPDDNGTVLITCPSLPEVTTFAASPGQIVRRANSAIEEALYARRADLPGRPSG